MMNQLFINWQMRNRGANTEGSDCTMYKYWKWKKIVKRSISMTHTSNEKMCQFTEKNWRGKCSIRLCWRWLSLVLQLSVDRYEFTNVSEVWTASIIAPITSETSVNSYQSTRRCNPKDRHLHSHRLENPKSYFIRRCYLQTYWCKGNYE
jgi:hypothetical protein